MRRNAKWIETAARMHTTATEARRRRQRLERAAAERTQWLALFRWSGMVKNLIDI